MKCTLLALGCLAAGAVSAAGLNDALVYDMALVPTEGTVTKTAIYDRLTHSAAKRTTAASVPVFSGDTSELGTPDPIVISNRVGKIPYYTQTSRTVNGTVYYYMGIPDYSEPSLEFPQTTVWNAASNTLYTYRQGVKLSNLPVSSNMTVYVRMWVDPAIINESVEEGNARCTMTVFQFTRKHGSNDSTKVATNPAYGIGMYLRREPSDGWRFMLDYGYYNVLGGSSGFGTGDCNCWVDYVLVLKTDPEAMTTHVTEYVARPGQIYVQGPTKLGYVGAQVLKFYDGNMSLGTDYSTVGATKWSTVSGNLKRQRATFRGGVSRFRIYNRPLTKDEVVGLFTEAHGGAVLVGTPNGRAEEFAAEDDADVAETFDPHSMPSSKMRGRLTAAHPTLTMDVPAKGCHNGLCKMLEVKPVLADLAGGSARVDVAVNGGKVGTLDLAREDRRILYVPRHRIATNGNGCVRYTLTRTGDLTGTLGIDSLEISGGWGEGLHRTMYADDPSDVWAPTAARFESTFVGHPLAQRYLDSFLYGPRPDGQMNMQQLTKVTFYVPGDIATNRETAYVFGFQYSDRMKANTYPILNLYLNGEQFQSYSNLAWYTAYTNVFAPGTLKAGYNTLMLSNATKVADISSLSYGATVSIDYHRFLVTPPKRGLMVFVR